ncbi:MAG: extracellular solute-binding protein [Tepidisphaeraceae bacterium]
MTLARASRLLLAFAALLLVAWSFFDVGRRTVIRWRQDHERPIVLTMLHWGDQAEDSVVAQLVERYMRENPKVQIIRINAGGDFRTKLKTMMAAGTPPDLFYLPADIFPELATLKLIRPVDDYVAADIAAGSKALYDDFFPIILDAFRYDAASGAFGKGPLYGLPKDFTTAVMYVNLDLFEKAGVNVPYDGWTWGEYEAVCRKITDLNKLPEFADRRIYGGFLQLWADSLRNVVWTFGGDYFGKNYRDVILDDPPAQEALDMIRRTRLDDQTVYNPSGDASRGGQEFFTGNIGCIGPIGRWVVPRYKSIDIFRWDVVPVPFKTRQDQASMIYYTAWVMSAGTKHPDECFKLEKFLCGGEGAVMQSHLGLAIPPLKSVAYSKDFLDPPGIPKHRAQIFLDAIAYARIQQIPREQEWGDILKNKIDNSIKLGQTSTLENAKEIERAWLAELDSPLRKHEWKPMRWGLIATVTLTALAGVMAILWWRARREKLGAIDRASERAGFAFILPWLIGFIALTLGPMIVSLLLSFSKWSAMTPMSDALGVGSANYRQLFTNDGRFYQSLKVTIYFVVLAVPLSQLAALGVALLMNARVRGIAAFRTIFFVPSLIVASVVGSVLWLQMYNNDYGIVNFILRPILGLFGAIPPDWFGRDAARWAIPAFVIMTLWGVGGAMILYLAGLKGIPTSLYEAATIDGAGQARKFWNVTLPMLSPLIFYNLVMGIIGSFQVFVQAMVMTQGGPDDLTLFYVLNLYRQAFEFHNMGYASALAWVLFLILLGLTVLIFRGSKNLVYYEGLKT